MFFLEEQKVQTIFPVKVVKVIFPDIFDVSK